MNVPLAHSYQVAIFCLYLEVLHQFLTDFVFHFKDSDFRALGIDLVIFLIDYSIIGIDWG